MTSLISRGWGRVAHEQAWGWQEEGLSDPGEGQRWQGLPQAPLAAGPAPVTEAGLGGGTLVPLLSRSLIRTDRASTVREVAARRSGMLLRLPGTKAGR